MFMVYSPEGRSFIGAVQQLPVLKVDPTKRINKVEESALKALNTEDQPSKSSASHQAALQAYQKNQASSERRVIVRAAELMSSPVISIEGEASIEQAWNLMREHEITHLPVLQQGELIGLCSQSQVLSRVIVNSDGELEGVKPEQVVDIMQAAVVTTHLDTDVRQVAQALMSMGMEAIVIMNDYGQMSGIITATDLITRLAKAPPLELYT